eukprot:scaffold40705_cov33-Phaeocystis_antarctica.AAC.2
MPTAPVAGGVSRGARRKAHRHASRAGRGPDSAPPLLTRDGALDLAQYSSPAVAYTLAHPPAATG